MTITTIKGLKFNELMGGAQAVVLLISETRCSADLSTLELEVNQFQATVSP